MCLTCPMHQAKGKSLNVHAPIRGGRNVQLYHMTGSPTKVGCSICGGKHSSQSHAGESARKLPGLGQLGKGYPGAITGHVKGTGRKLRLGK